MENRTVRMLSLVTALTILSATLVHSRVLRDRGRRQVLDHPILSSEYADDEYMIGTGIADITGPCVEVGFMGYGKTSQKGSGLHSRLFSRAFVVSRDPGARDGEAHQHVVFVSADIGMITDIIVKGVVEKLQGIYGEQYNYGNVMLTSTHTHSGPGGYHQYVLYNIPNLGFSDQNYNAIVDGLVESIVSAHSNLRAGHIQLTQGELTDASINRSPEAYMMNPEAEREQYQHDRETRMTVIKFITSQGEELGMISWFGIHCTNMGNSNELVSGDNKGYASYMFEKMMEPSSLPGKNKFVAAFAQSNEGDNSPNIAGAFCTNTGNACHMGDTACDGCPQCCVAQGPGDTDEESTMIIGQKQFDKAKELYESLPDTSGSRLSGSVDYRYQNVDMPSVSVTTQDGNQEKLCTPAMGYSFAAGTIDGPGEFDFEQGTTEGNPMWDAISSLLSGRPSDQQVACQSPKPILLDTGEISFPFAWQPDIVPTQILKIGNLILVGLPGEFTTMAGRRLRNAVRQVFIDAGYAADSLHVVLAGLSNSYTSYVATDDEYMFQRYEGASTIYGPNTLAAYQKIYGQLATAITEGSPVSPGPSIPDLKDKQLSFILGVLFDMGQYGKVVQDVDTSHTYTKGDEVSVTFAAANPRNDLRRGDTYLTVERFDEGANTWQVTYTDADWSTKFVWRRVGVANSEAHVSWTIPDTAHPGLYRITHRGTSKGLFTGFSSYSGISGQFVLA